MLTDKERKEILDRNSDDPIMYEYILKVLDNAPNLDNPIHIEGIAVEWNQAEQLEMYKNITFDEAVSRYKKTYAYEAKVAEKCGEKMPPLDLDLSKPETTYVINEELTAATIEAHQKMGNVIEAGKRYIETGSPFDPDDPKEKFFGTVVNEETMAKVQRCNELLEVISAGSFNVKVEKFEKPDPLLISAHFALEVTNTSPFDGTIMTALSGLFALADSVTFFPRDGMTRVAFTIDNLWKEHRTMTEDEYLDSLGFYEIEEDEETEETEEE